MYTFSIKVQETEIKGNIHLPNRVPAPCVLCSHGLFSTKESPKYTWLAKDLSTTGFVVLRYDHRGCGQSAGNIEDTSISSRLEDLSAVFSFARNHPSVNDNIGLLGSSMGGYISLFLASQYPSVNALSVWSTPFKLSKNKKHYLQDGLPTLNDCFFYDLEKYDLEKVLKNIKHCLVLHGEKDEVVPTWQSHKIYKLLERPKDLFVFSGADHRFINNNIRQKAIELSREWFKKHLLL